MSWLSIQCAPTGIWRHVQPGAKIAQCSDNSSTTSFEACAIGHRRSLGRLSCSRTNCGRLLTGRSCINSNGIPLRSLDHFLRISSARCQGDKSDSRYQDLIPTLTKQSRPRTPTPLNSWTMSSESKPSFLHFRGKPFSSISSANLLDDQMYWRVAV
jgi:hypothetical protein